MKILAVGDVCGAAGVDVLRFNLPALRGSLGADIVIVNGENANMRGISPDFADSIFKAGADVITLGNHSFDNRRICGYFDQNKYIIRPQNLPHRLPGNGFVLFDAGPARVCVGNLIGRLYMDVMSDSPFDAADHLLKSVDADIYIFDFHAHATSEKKAMGYYLDGRASVLFGTHTHVQTADEQVLPNGLGYITDVGMTGSQHSVIGVKHEQSVEFFKTGLAPRFENADTDLHIQGALFELNGDGTCVKASRVDVKHGG